MRFEKCPCSNSSQIWFCEVIILPTRWISSSRQEDMILQLLLLVELSIYSKVSPPSLTSIRHTLQQLLKWNHVHLCNQILTAIPATATRKTSQFHREAMVAVNGNIWVCLGRMATVDGMRDCVLVSDDDDASLWQDNFALSTYCKSMVEKSLVAACW